MGLRTKAHTCCHANHKPLPVQVLENGHTLILGWSNKVGVLHVSSTPNCVRRCCHLHFSVYAHTSS